MGARLPAVPLWETSASANYERPLFADYSGFASVDWRFTGSRYSDFVASGPRENLPAFNIFDLQAGVETQAWSLSLYAKNIGNEVGINYLLRDTFAYGLGPQSATIITPRTIGATVTAKY